MKFLHFCICENFIFTLRIICRKTFDIDKIKMMNQLKAEMIVIFYGVDFIEY